MEKTYKAIIDKLAPYLTDKKGLIFDLDGTLLDSMGAWRELDANYMSRFGIVVDEEYKQAIAAMTLPMASEYISSHYDEIPYSPKEVEQQLMELMEENYRYKLNVKKFVPEVLAYFKNQGYAMIVATANEYELCEAALKRNDVLELVDGIITCTMAGEGKEHPTVYLKACEMMGITYKEAIVFEDTLHSVKTAKGAGFTVVGVYDEDAKNSWDEICSSTDVQIDFE